jgi:hypothetical protein
MQAARLLNLARKCNSFGAIALQIYQRLDRDCLRKYGAPGEIRTPGLLVRSQTLYPAELRAHTRGFKRNHRQIIRDWQALQLDEGGPGAEIRPQARV